MRRGVLLGVLLVGVLGLPASAHAVLLVTPQGQRIGGKWQRWANGAKVPTISGRMTLGFVMPKPCGHVDGCDLATRSRVVGIYVRPTAHDARFALMHELGHAFDRRYFTPIERHRFEYLDGWDHHDPSGYVPWSVHGLDPPGSPIEDFANTYASCAIYGPYPHTWYMNEWPGWDCNWGSYRASCALIRTVRT